MICLRETVDVYVRAVLRAMSVGKFPELTIRTYDILISAKKLSYMFR